MRLRKVLSAFSVVACCVWVLSGVQDTQHIQQNMFVALADNDLISTNQADFEIEVAEKVEETEGLIVQEKIAMRPEYIFDDSNETMYTLHSTQLKKEPYDDAEIQQDLTRFSELKITGKNNLKYWRTNIEGIDYYVNSEELTSDTNYVFTVTDTIKYCSGDLEVYEKPDSSSSVIANLSFNDEIHIIGTNNNKYYLAQINGEEGYVNKNLLMNNKKPTYSQNTSSSELETIWAIVMQEAGANYEGALAVMSSAINRTQSSRWSYLGDTVYEQLTAPGQYCYSIDTYWIKYLNGNVPDIVKQAVADGLNGKTNHDYTCFRSTSGGDPSRVNIGGNWFFGN